jgi:DnaJ-class molecular chaperone
MAQYEIMARCTKCEGSGKVITGFPESEQDCDNCSGKGEVTAFMKIKGLKSDMETLLADVAYIKGKVG